MNNKKRQLRQKEKSLKAKVNLYKNLAKQGRGDTYTLKLYVVELKRIQNKIKEDEEKVMTYRPFASLLQN